MSTQVQALSLTSVAEHCADESEKFRKKQAYDAAYCFELFRRALAERLDEAWSLLFVQYERLVLNWVYEHPAFAQLDVSAESCLSAAFQRFWHALPAEKFTNRFTALEPLLKYLKLCVGAAILDLARAKQRRTQLQPLEEIAEQVSSGATVEAQVAQNQSRKTLWDTVLTLTNTEQERTVLQDALVYNFSAADIARRHPHLFDNVKQVYRVKENVLKRLRRNDALRTLAGMP